MICDLITEETYLEDVKCNSWEELVDIGGGLLVKQGRVEIGRASCRERV